MATEYTTEILTAMKTTELRKLAGSMGIRRMSSARKEQLIPAILAEQAMALTESAQKAHRTETGEVKGKLCAECGVNKVDKKTQGRDSTMCASCFKQAEIQNEHFDGGHDETPMSNCGLCNDVVRPTKEISPKALRFEADAREAGWAALARNAADGSGISLVTATAPDGRKLELHWRGKLCVDGENFLVRTDGKKVKVRNASAARKILFEA